MDKFGKKYGDIASLKGSFLTDNESHLQENNRIARIYKRQPKRERCKLCGERVTDTRIFYSHDIKYHICDMCGHINGDFLETSDFTLGIYEKSDYGKNYMAETESVYNERLHKIYTPKVEFMKEVFSEKNIPYADFHYLDVGAGSGYFIGALLKEGLDASGIEVSESQVQFGNRMLGSNASLVYMDEAHITERIKNATEEVISFIGVLEHVLDLNEVLDAVSNNEHIRYVFFSVPMFSYSVIWEAVNAAVFNRLLGGAHTHIFTDSSLAYMYKKYGWEVIGQWRFGTDAADLFRTVLVKLHEQNNGTLADIFQEKFGGILDDIQLLMDKNNFCSEIHVLVEKV